MANTEVAGAQPSSKFRLRRPKLAKWQKILLALIALALLATAASVFYARYNNLKKENVRLSNPQEAAKLETQQLKTTVGKLIELPANEDPTIATVVDASKLKSQAFFASAQNGDKVLLFSQAKKAILYRPSTNKVIEVAPINIGNNTQNTSSTPSTQGASTTNQQ